jgi:putative endonuclease
MTNDRAVLARWGESLAADYLLERGFEILDRNFRTPHGELDLIGRQGATTVFIEVKTRRSKRFGWPEQSITKKKIAHINTAAEAYLLAHPGLGREWRIDVIAIQLEPETNKVSLRHYEHAVR